MDDTLVVVVVAVDGTVPVVFVVEFSLLSWANLAALRTASGISPKICPTGTIGVAVTVLVAGVA